jgi:hypothetical protein
MAFLFQQIACKFQQYPIIVNEKNFFAHKFNCLFKLATDPHRPTQTAEDLDFLNRRRTQICADSIFSLLDQSKEKLHALRANSFNYFII